MKKTRKVLFLMLALLFMTAISNYSKAQVSAGGTPPSFAEGGTIQKSTSTIPLIDLPVTFNVADLRAEDEINRAKGMPLRLGVSISAKNLNLLEKGTWSTLANGQRVCRLAIRAEGAIALSMYYSKFYIPKGGKLYIYNKSKTNVIGAYTHETNLGSKAFATEYTAGDEAIFEYVAPAETPGLLAKKKITGGSILVVQAPVDKQEQEKTPQIIISNVGYAYSDKVVIIPSKTKAGIGSGGSCMVNINCVEGEDWQVEKNSIARLVIFRNGGQFFCSGTLLNNTSGDFTPYVITAHHCFADATAEELSQTLFFFHYEHPGCANVVAEPPYQKTITGAIMRVDITDDGDSDGVLVELTQRVPDDYGLYWSGWDRRNIPLTSGVNIHHPEGDVMKISTITTPAMSSTWTANPPGGTDAHWQVYFSSTPNGHGVTEQGSSGSGLFNQSHRLVGTLTGGRVTQGVPPCNATQNESYYGKLWWHWDQASDQTQKMKTYLDPINSGADTIDGRFLTGNSSSNFSVVSPTAYAGEEVHYVDLSYGATSWEWEFPGGIPATSTERNPVVIYEIPGTYTATLTINASTDNLFREKRDIVTITQKAVHCDAETFTIGTGTATSDFPLGASTMQTYSASVYSKNEIGQRSGLIDKISWNAGAASSTARKVSIYLKEVSDSTLTANTWDNEVMGATLVYESANTYTTASGWVDVALPTPFNYSGTRHLKVLVHTLNSVGTSETSSCYYTTTALNTHMTWTAADANPVAGNGLLNSNRPNIKLGYAAGDCGKAPKAIFEMLGNPVYQQSFDSYTFPPANWEVTKSNTGTSENVWQAGNILTRPFTLYDPANIVSAAVSPSTIGLNIDTWLISDGIQLSADANSMRFYIGYNQQKTSGLSLTFYISTDNKTTWQQKWVAPEGTSPWGWFPIKVYLSQYVGQKVYFAWRAQGTSGDFITIDDVKVYDNSPDINIYEGDVVSLTDRSTGPPVQLKWDLPGATPNTSSASMLQPRYNDQGVYKVALTVKNNIGIDSLVIPAAVTVTSRMPVAIMTSTAGYTRAINHKNFIPIGGVVNYADTSLYVPKTWAWTFDGGTPASSTDKKVSVHYNAEGEYATGLVVSNAAGSDDTLVNNYLKVGGEDRIWNMPNNDFGKESYIYGDEADGDGYFIGTNVTKSDKFAEFFAAPQGVLKISAIDVWFKIHGDKVAGEKLKVGIYSCYSGLKHYPEHKLASVELPIDQITSDAYTKVILPEPVLTSTRFYVVVEGFSTIKTPISIATSELSFYSRNTAWVYHFGDGWITMADYAGEGIGVALNVVPTVTYLYMNILSSNNYALAFDDETAKTVNVTSNTNWTISTTQPWITLDKSQVSENGSFTFKCESNPEDVDRYGVIVLNGGGDLIKRIYIKQATGDSIVNIKASLLDDFTSVNVRWGNAAIDNVSAAASSVVLPTIMSSTVLADNNLPQSKLIEITADDTLGYSTYAAPKALRWHNGIFYKQYAYGDKKTFRVATLFYPEDLLQDHGGELNAIDFYPNGLGDFRLMIYQNEILVVDSVLKTITPRRWNRVDISNKGVVVDATKSLRITLEIGALANSGVITYDAGPAVNGKGNLIDSNMDGYWVPLTAFADFESSGNWLISAYVKKQDSPSSYYRLYRNGSLIAETDKSSYIDERVMIAGDFCYQVAKVSNQTGVELPKSAEACVTIKPVLLVAANNLKLDYGDRIPTTEEVSNITGVWENTIISQSIIKQPTVSIRSDITSTSPVGVYPGAIVISGLEIENSNMYNIRYINAQLRIYGRPVVVTPTSNAKKSYGDPDPAVIPYAVDNMANGEQLVGELSRKVGEGVGLYPLEKSTLNETNNPNYVISIAPSSAFEIKPRLVTVTPIETSKIYGNSDPATLLYTEQNGLPGEPLVGHLMRETGENVGEYNILQGQLDNVRNSNYNITFKTGRKFTIEPREVTVTPEPASKLYGSPDPIIPFKAVGLLNNEPIQGALARVSGENAGQYDISLGTLSVDNNYKIKFNPGMFVINPANLFVQANNINISSGSLLPSPTYTMRGYKAEDELMLKSIIDNSIYINADQRPNAGIYKILFGSNFVHKNYDATFVEGQLTVSGTPVTAFVPGSANSKNATFMPEGAKHIKVFTRNGVLVYEGNTAWDGNNKQGKVEAGVYYYVATMADGSTVKGSVEVYKF